MSEESMNVVAASFTNVSSDVNDDLDGVQLGPLVDSSLCSCSTAVGQLRHMKRKTSWVPHFSTHHDGEEYLKGKLTNDVQRYLKVKDKYLALASLLFKSQAFHHTYPPSDLRRQLSLVDLPRTQKGKPFIPTTFAMKEQESNVYPISVSHQFPWAGSARLINDYSDQSHRGLHLGMDIVVFDPINSDLYDSVEEFVSVFRDCFTTREWQRLHSGAGDVLEEFHLRWCMKEAYTKALGEGMHLNFATFEIRLDGVDCEDGSEQSISSAISSTKDGTHLLRGVVKRNGQLHAASWDFYFLPLSSNESQGCACICLGPLPENCAPAFETRIHWTTVRELIQWHKEM